MLLIVNLGYVHLTSSFDVENENRAVLRTDNDKLTVRRYTKFGLLHADGTGVLLFFEAWFIQWLPSPHVPYLHNVILTARNDIALIRSKSSASDLVPMCIGQRVN